MESGDMSHTTGKFETEKYVMKNMLWKICNKKYVVKNM